MSDDPRALRAALIRLLWRSVADGDYCAKGTRRKSRPYIDEPGACEPDDLLDVCEAFRALGWGKHWNSLTFQRKVDAERKP